MLRQCLQKVFQVVVGVRIVCFRRLDQGEQGCGSFGTGDGIAEQPVAPGGRKGFDGSFAKPVVGRDHRIIKKPAEFFLVLQRVLNRIPEGFGVCRIIK